MLKSYLNSDAVETISCIKECIFEITGDEKMSSDGFLAACYLYDQDENYLIKIAAIATMLSAICLVCDEDILMNKMCKKLAKFSVTYLKIIGA